VPKGKLAQNNQDRDPCNSPRMSRLETQKLIEMINHQRSLKYRNKISITPKTYSDIKISRTNKMPPHALTLKAFPKPRQVLHTKMPPCMRTGRPTRCCDPGDGTRNPLRQNPTTPHIAIAFHTIAAYVSPMVVSPITETVVLLYLYQESIISVHFQTMLRCPTCHNSYMPRSFRQHTCSPIISKAATCHDFYMLRSFKQHACSCVVCSHKPENAARRDATEKGQTKPGTRGQKAPCSFLVLRPKFKNERGGNKFPSKTLY
jgi:hypothetical protein